MPALSRSEIVCMAAEMLFPQPLQQPRQGKTPEIDDANRAELQAAIESSQIKRWQYTQDISTEDLLLFAAHLPNEPANILPEESTREDSLITLKPFEPTADGLIRILTTKAGLMAMFQRAPAAIRRIALEASVKGQVAGSLLWYMFVMSKSESIAPSLTKARDLCLDRYPKRFNSAKGRPSKARTKVIHSLTNGGLKRIWREYQPVAHLWASYLAIKNDQLEPVHMPLEKISLVDFFGTAQLLTEFGCQFRIPGTFDQHPLNRDELAWPSIKVQGDLTHLEKNLLSDEVVSFVRTFKFKNK